MSPRPPTSRPPWTATPKRRTMTESAAPPIGVGLLGFGGVGQSVYRTLAEQRDYYAARSGRAITVPRIAVRDRARSRTLSVDPGVLTDDALAIATDPALAVIVEVMGGVEPAITCIRAALEAGKHVVTANKEVMAIAGPELLELAYQRNVELLYEASVGGGIPIIAPLQRDLHANEVAAVQAIINGTTNFMLTAMAREGLTYEAALAEAQRRGYAEPDPTNDVDGTDAAYKLAILATLAFHVTVRPDDVYREGITQLTPKDFTYARRLGYIVRLVATARRAAGGLDVRVHPTLLPEDDPLAKVDGVLNAIAVEGNLVGRALFEGPGAGPVPTTSAVIADLLDIVRGIASGRPPRPPRPPSVEACIQPVGSLRMQYYLRALVRDRPGVLAEIGSALADNNISIASLLQMEADAVAGTAEIAITTHHAREADCDRFLAQAARLDAVVEQGIRLRIEDPRG